MEQLNCDFPTFRVGSPIQTNSDTEKVLTAAGTFSFPEYDLKHRHLKSKKCSCTLMYCTQICKYTLTKQTNLNGKYDYDDSCDTFFIWSDYELWSPKPWIKRTTMTMMTKYRWIEIIFQFHSPVTCH